MSGMLTSRGVSSLLNLLSPQVIQYLPERLAALSGKRVVMCASFYRVRGVHASVDVSP